MLHKSLSNLLTPLVRCAGVVGHAETRLIFNGLRDTFWPTVRQRHNVARDPRKWVASDQNGYVSAGPHSNPMHAKRASDLR